MEPPFISMDHIHRRMIGKIFPEERARSQERLIHRTSSCSPSASRKVTLQKSDPSAERRRKPKLSELARAMHWNFSSTTSSQSPPRSPLWKKRLTLRHQTKSDSSLMDWLPTATCCHNSARVSDPEVQTNYALKYLTLTPISFDVKTDSLEVRKTTDPVIRSPLPWETFSGDYPQWIVDEIVTRSKGLSKAKNEDRSRSFTIPNLPSQAATTSAVLIEEVVKTSSSHPSDLDTNGSAHSGHHTKLERYNSIRRNGRHVTADITLPDEVPEIAMDSFDDRETSPKPPPLISRRSALTNIHQILSESRTPLTHELPDGEHLSLPMNSQRRRSSVVVIPPMQICPGDLLIYNQGSVSSAKPPRSPSHFERHRPVSTSVINSPDFTGSTASLSSSEPGSAEPRKKPWSIMKLFERNSRGKNDPANLEDQLLTLKLSDFSDESLMRYKILHWSDLTPMTSDLAEAEVKRREAIWEMFQSELVLLFDHLLVLKHVFLEPLKQLQVENFLMHVTPEKLFGNLDELISTNYELCSNFAQMMEKAAKENDSFSVDIPKLLRSQQQETVSEFQLDQHSTNLAFQRYCLNYIKSLDYLETCRKSEDFNEYEKFCSQDRRCHRLQLTDLLVTPVQHTMKRPLLLKEICKYMERCGMVCKELKVILEETEASLRGLDEKINWLRNFEKLQEIQRQLIWPSVVDLQDPKIYIPDVLKSHLAKQPCESLILSPRRIIIQEGILYMVENGKPVETQVFLFDDMLLLTRKRKGLVKKKSSVSDQWSQAASPESSTRYVVYKQPMPLDRIMVHDLSASDQANPLTKNSIVILQATRYQQIISAVTLQAGTEQTKMLWLTKIRLAMDRWKAAHLETNHHRPIEPTFSQLHFSTVSEF